MTLSGNSQVDPNLDGGLGWKKCDRESTGNVWIATVILQYDPIIIIYLNQTTIWIIKKFKFGVWGQEEKYNKYGELPCSQTYMIEKTTYAPYTVWLVPRNTWDCSGRHLLCLVVSVLGPGDIGKHLWTSTQGNETTSDCFLFLVFSNYLCPFVVGHMGPNGSSGCGSDIFTLAFFWRGHWAHGIESTASHPKCQFYTENDDKHNKHLGLVCPTVDPP